MLHCGKVKTQNNYECLKNAKGLKEIHSFFLGGVLPSNVVRPAFLFLTNEVC